MRTWTEKDLNKNITSLKKVQSIKIMIFSLKLAKGSMRNILITFFMEATLLTGKRCVTFQRTCVTIEVSSLKYFSWRQWTDIIPRLYKKSLIKWDKEEVLVEGNGSKVLSMTFSQKKILVFPSRRLSSEYKECPKYGGIQLIFGQHQHEMKSSQMLIHETEMIETYKLCALLYG